MIHSDVGVVQLHSKSNFLHLPTPYPYTQRSLALELCGHWLAGPECPVFPLANRRRVLCFHWQRFLASPLPQESLNKYYSWKKARRFSLAKKKKGKQSPHSLPLFVAPFGGNSVSYTSTMLGS